LGAEHEGIFFSLKRRNAVSNFLKRGASWRLGKAWQGTLLIRKPK
jgi:hypothetical protein